MEKPDFFSYDSPRRQKCATIYRPCTHVHTGGLPEHRCHEKERKYVLRMECFLERNSSEVDVVNLFKITIFIY